MRARARASCGRGDGAPFVQLNHPRQDAATSSRTAPTSRISRVAGEPLRSRARRSTRSRTARSPSATRIGPPRPRLRRRRAAERPAARSLPPGARRLALAAAPGRRARGRRQQRLAQRRPELPGVPRNYVALADDALASFDEAAFFAALRAGRAFATTGPLARRPPRRGGPGRALRRRGAACCASRCDAAPWVPVRSLLVHRDGGDRGRARHPRGERVELPLALRARRLRGGRGRGRRPTRPGRRSLPGFTPFAIANPIFVDADGDGAWTAPGLPDAPPPLLADPLRSGLPRGERDERRRERERRAPARPMPGQDLRAPVPVAHGPAPRRGGLAARAGRSRRSCSRSRPRATSRSRVFLHSEGGHVEAGDSIHDLITLREAARAHDRHGLGRERRHAHLPGGAEEGPLLPAEHALHDPPAARRRRRARRPTSASRPRRS